MKRQKVLNSDFRTVLLIVVLILITFSGHSQTRGTFIDERNYEEYWWIKIGNQTWMAENLNIGIMLSSGSEMPSDKNKIEKWCYDNDEASCHKYGGMYNWPEMMHFDSLGQAGYKGGNWQGICPDGWRLPTNDDWIILEMYLGMTREDADKMHDRGKEQAKKLTDGGSSGFNALMGGYRSNGNYVWFFEKDQVAGFWSSTDVKHANEDKKLVYYRLIHTDEPRITLMRGNKDIGAYVRCIKNN